MEIKLLSHACALIKGDEFCLLTDPWLAGEVFNNGWGLVSSLDKTHKLTDQDIDDITHIYISHEHPDHFHVPSLRAILERRDDATPIKVLIKKDERTKDVELVLNNIGFKSVIRLPHMEEFALDVSKNVFCQIYHHRHIDSALVIKQLGGFALINLNDAELSVEECARLSRGIACQDIVLLNQFSIAGFDGINSADSLAEQARSVIGKMLDQHRSFSAFVTIPFASFCRFVKPDNAFLNDYHNSLRDVYLEFQKQSLNCFCLEPPTDYISVDQILSLGSSPPCESLATPSMLPLEAPVDFDEIVDVINKRLKLVLSFSNSILFKISRPSFLDVHVLDIERFLRIDFSRGRAFEIPATVENEAYMLVNSQPLFYAFSNSFGLQTLGVSGRYVFVNVESVPLAWKFYRIITSLHNNKTPLRFSSLANPFVWQSFCSRWETIGLQIRCQFSRFFGS